MRLFEARGYEASTLDEIADDADVSRRSLFDYFSTKEDLAFAHQDDFVPALVEEIRQRPQNEPWPVLVEVALAQAVANALTPRSVGPARHSSEIRGPRRSGRRSAAR